MSKKDNRKAEITIKEPEVKPPEDLPPEQYDDFLRCARFIELYETGEKVSMQYIADLWGIDRTTLYEWKNKWIQTGLMQKIRIKYFLPKTVDQIQRANTDVAEAWPDIVQRQLDIAIHGKSDQFSHNAAAWLYETIIKPMTEQVEEVGSDEMDYIRQLEASSDLLNPMAISGIIPTLASSRKEQSQDSETRPQSEQAPYNSQES